MSDARPAVSLPIVHAFFVVGLVGSSGLYAVFFSERILGTPVVAFAALVYLCYLAYRSVRAVERLSYG